MIKEKLKAKKFSDMEIESALLLYQGFNEAQIALRLNIPKVSVISHLGKARRKAGWDNNRMMCYQIRELSNGV